MSKPSSFRCLITAGPTQEYIDPVRYISNPSSGKMGYAIAKSALNKGWTVDLVSGPVNEKEPKGAILYPVTSAEEMYHQVDALFDVCDICIMTAAVSDFTARELSKTKIKKATAVHELQLKPTRDILKAMCLRKSKQLVIGFAAETESLERNAKEKLKDKGCDWIIANQVGLNGVGFNSDDNAIIIFMKDGKSYEYGPTSKLALAEIIVQSIADRLKF